MVDTNGLRRNESLLDSRPRTIHIHRPDKVDLYNCQPCLACVCVGGLRGVRTEI